MNVEIGEFLWLPCITTKRYSSDFGYGEWMFIGIFYNSTVHQRCELWQRIE